MARRRRIRRNRWRRRRNRSKRRQKSRKKSSSRRRRKRIKRRRNRKRKGEETSVCSQAQVQGRSECIPHRRNCKPTSCFCAYIPGWKIRDEFGNYSHDFD